MQSWKVHYKNKYPGCSIRESESSFDVYSKSGEHLISVRKNGAGQMLDMSEADGLPERHDLAPIPRDARVFKVMGGKIAHDDKAKAREKAREEFVRGEKVASCDELSQEGYEFSAKGDVSLRPSKKAHKAE